MKIALRIKYASGEVRDVDAVFADFVGFERAWQRSIAKFESEIRLTDLAWLAWSAETRAKRTSLKFDPEWIVTVETVEMRTDEESTDPKED